MEATFIPYGATITHLVVPDKEGTKRDVILGWDDPINYCAVTGRTQDAALAEHTYFGATIGRIANRIAKGTFKVDGKTYHTPLNDHSYDTLHGGWVGFDRHIWTITHRSETSVTWSTVSPDGEMGFPGNLEVNVTHTITEENEWKLDYSAKTDATTIVAMTNHAYFNLNANIDNTETVLEHELTMPTGTKMEEVTGAPDYHLIPTGKVNTISLGSPWDFTGGKSIGKDINKGDVTALGGYDNAWIFADWKAGMSARPVAVLSSPLTGITLEMSTDQPSVQIYTGNFLNGTDTNSSDTGFQIPRKASQGGPSKYYQWRGAITLEAQQYIDAQNHPNFPSIELKPGERYEQHTVYKLTA
jgi:aldose 1-epimerase